MAVEEIAEEFLKYSQGVAASSWVFTVNLKWRKVVIQLHWSEVSINSTGRQRLRHFTVLSACVCVACCYCFNSRKSVWPHTVEKFSRPKAFHTGNITLRTFTLLQVTVDDLWQKTEQTVMVHNVSVQCFSKRRHFTPDIQLSSSACHIACWRRCSSESLLNK